MGTLHDPSKWFDLTPEQWRDLPPELKKDGQPLFASDWRNIFGKSDRESAREMVEEYVRQPQADRRIGSVSDERLWAIFHDVYGD